MLAIESLAFEYGRRIKKLTGLDIWTINRRYQNVNTNEQIEWYKAHPWQPWDDGKSNLKMIELIRTNGMLDEVNEMATEFESKVLNLRVSQKKEYIVRHIKLDRYVYKYYPRGLYRQANITLRKEFAQTFSYYKAKEVAQIFEDYMIEKITQNHVA